MARSTPEFYTFNPFDSHTAWLFPELANRIKLFAHDVARDSDSEAFTRRFLARLVLGDTNVRAAVAVADNGIVAHAIAEIAIVDSESVLFALQVEIDPGFSSIVDNLEQEVDNWARSMNVKTVRTEIIPQNSTKAWLRLYEKRGWRLISTVMERKV